MQFLIANNIYFNNITVTLDILSILPDDDSISNAHILTVDCNSVSSTFDTSEQCNTEEDPEHLTTMFVAGNYQSMTEEVNIRSMEEFSSNSSVTWPTRSHNTINKFSTEG